MKATRLCFVQMLKYMRRDMMLFAACIAPLLAGLVFRFGVPLLEAALTSWLDISEIISPFYVLIDVLFAMLSPAMFAYVSAMVGLEEKDDKTAAYLFITPLGKNGYLVSRLGVSSAAAFVVTVVLLPIFKLTSLSAVEIILLAAGGTLQGVIVALLILSISSNKLEGMAVAKLSTIMVFGAAVPFFIKHEAGYLVSPLPSFWIGKAVSGNTLLYILPAFGLSAVWIFMLIRRYLRKI